MSDKGQFYFNGIVHTMDPVCPAAGSVAVQDGKIIAVGDREECAGALEKGYEPVDLKGRTLLPGFMDTHLHPIMLIYSSMNCDLGGVTSIVELKQELRQVVARKNDSSWLAGLNFDEQNMQEKRVPLRQDLDEISTDRPVVIIKHDGHSVFANTRAIETAGVTALTPTLRPALLSVKLTATRQASSARWRHRSS